jgi:hypothetical protein
MTGIILIVTLYKNSSSFRRNLYIKYTFAKVYGLVQPFLKVGLVLVQPFLKVGLVLVQPFLKVGLVLVQPFLKVGLVLVQPFFKVGLVLVQPFPKRLVWFWFNLF